MIAKQAALILSLFSGLVISYPTSADVGEGAQIYHDFCSVCHGDKGDGKSRASRSLNPAPRDFSTPTSAGELSRARMIASVANGRPGTAMTAWNHQLTASQIEAVVDYVRETFMLGTVSADSPKVNRLYAEYCSVCHGDRGNGISRASRSLNPPPRDFTSKRAAEELTRERMIFSVTYGRPNTAMTAWGTQLSQEEISELVEYIRDSFMVVETDSAATTADNTADKNPDSTAHDAPGFMLAEMPLGLKGDVAWGAQFYQNNCATCHGASGDGRGPRAYFIFPKPRDFREPAAQKKFNRPALYEAISLGSLRSEMPAWNKVLTEQEIANVTEYVFQQFIRKDDQAGR